MLGLSAVTYFLASDPQDMFMGGVTLPAHPQDTGLAPYLETPSKSPPKPTAPAPATFLMWSRWSAKEGSRCGSQEQDPRPCRRGRSHPPTCYLGQGRLLSAGNIVVVEIHHHQAACLVLLRRRAGLWAQEGAPPPGTSPGSRADPHTLPHGPSPPAGAHDRARCAGVGTGCRLRSG